MGSISSNPLVHEVAALNQKPKLYKLKLYTMELSKAVGIQNELTKVVEKLEKVWNKIDFEIAYLTRQSRQNPNEIKSDEKFMVNYSDGKGNTFPLYLGVSEWYKGIDRGNHMQTCLSKNLSRGKYFDYLKRFSKGLDDQLSKVGQKETASFFIKILIWMSFDLKFSMMRVLQYLNDKRPLTVWAQMSQPEKF